MRGVQELGSVGTDVVHVPGVVLPSQVQIRRMGFGRKTRTVVGSGNKKVPRLPGL